MDHKERMLANLPYKAWLDGLSEERLENKKKIYRYNHLEPGNPEEKDSLIKDILGKCGDYINIEPPFFCVLFFFVRAFRADLELDIDLRMLSVSSLLPSSTTTRRDSLLPNFLIIGYHSLTTVLILEPSL